jgi:homoserine O-succinyltransferase
MPDAALRATERQFESLLSAAAGQRIDIELSLYSLPEIARSGNAALRVHESYRRLEDLWGGSLDALIVTGREPLKPRLRDEAYWESFTRLHAWARENTYSTVWSCLAAHAAVLHDDGIERIKNPHKLSGVYECERYSISSLTEGLPLCFPLPHSRWNSISANALQHNGYQILSCSAETGPDIFVKECRSLFVFFQGHPEYQAKTLMLEYGRDFSRYLSGVTTSLPMIPCNYFDEQTETLLADIHREAELFRDSSLEKKLAEVMAKIEIRDRWEAAATRIYGNWLDSICAKKYALHALPSGVAQRLAPSKSSTRIAGGSFVSPVA